ncbi:hypothetical protein CEXT_429811 [Caerostris extrusa]|uniref:Uncharacterized protein n=1 Tax=Caerostris extrusa TaxID=172846 RepID=A0AAV4Q1B1_CAEEX|nr:hypothetical protein CEXT_429811 [Caerostris extrusa]
MVHKERSTVNVAKKPNLLAHCNGCKRPDREGPCPSVLQSETRALLEPVPLVGPSSPTLSDRTEAFLRVRGQPTTQENDKGQSATRSKVPDPKKIQNTLLKELEEKEKKKFEWAHVHPRKVGKPK